MKDPWKEWITDRVGNWRKAIPTEAERACDLGTEDCLAPLCLHCGLPTLHPRLLRTQGLVGASGISSPLPHVMSMGWPWDGGGTHLHPHRPQGPAPQSQHRGHPRTHPTPEGPRACYSWPQVPPRISLQPRSPLNSAKLLSTSYRWTKYCPVPRYIKRA